MRSIKSNQSKTLKILLVFTLIMSMTLPLLTLAGSAEVKAVKKISITAGKTKTVKISGLGKKTKVTWKIGNKTIAKVVKKGTKSSGKKYAKIKGLKAGKTTLKAKYKKNGKTVTKKYNIVVTAAGISADTDTTQPTDNPAVTGTSAPTVNPTGEPVVNPTLNPDKPTDTPADPDTPTAAPTDEPGDEPTQAPETTPTPNTQPTSTPTPTVRPTPTPTVRPTPTPTAKPTATPTAKPSATPYGDYPALDEDNLAVANYPTIFSDVPDTDFIRVGENYYMVSTTMNMSPGAPIMKSTDLVHWKIVNYVYDTLFNDDKNNLNNGQNVYRNGQWASAIRYDEASGLYYVCFNSNGYGFFVFTTNDIENGTWKKHFINANFHDPGLLIDDGKIYVFYGGGPNNCQQIELDDENEAVKRVGANRAVIQKGSQWGLWEGCHAYHIGDYYYVMIIASPSSGWFRSETCYRTKGLFDSNWNGQWEEQIIFQGSTYEYGTGIAQGGIVDTIYGDWYGMLFQDHDAIGRIPSILAVNWNYTDSNGKNYKDWPMMGYYDDNGSFVSCQSTSAKVQRPLTIRLNNDSSGSYIVGNDDFDYGNSFNYASGDRLKLVWQWNHNPDHNNWSVTERSGFYRIKNGKTASSVWYARNSLTQRTVGPTMTSETCMIPTSMKPGDYAGMVAVGSAYGMVGVRCDNSGNRYIFQGSGSYDQAITVNASAGQVSATTPVYLKIEYQFNTGNTRADTANFFYSLDGSSWTRIGNQLSMSFSTSTTFMGARTWLSNYATGSAGGYVDFDYYKVSSSNNIVEKEPLIAPKTENGAAMLAAAAIPETSDNQTYPKAKTMTFIPTDYWTEAYAAADQDPIIFANFNVPSYMGNADRVELTKDKIKGYTIWDEDYLYVLYDVTDSDIAPTSTNGYDTDSVEFFLDEDNSGETTYSANRDAIQVRINAIDNYFTANENGTAVYDLIAHAVQPKKDGANNTIGYYAEFVIKFTKKHKTGDTLGMDLQINDCYTVPGTGGDPATPSRAGTVTAYDTTNEGFQNPSVFGKIKLK